MVNRRFLIRLFIATVVRKFRVFYYKIIGVNLYYSTIIESSVFIDKLNPKGIYIGKNTLVAGGVTILSHDHCKRVGDNAPFLTDTKIGDRCFIAVNSLILPGVTIGDEVIVGAGSVVTKDVKSNSVVAGNPAKIIRENIKMNDFASLENWSEENGWN